MVDWHGAGHHASRLKKAIWIMRCVRRRESLSEEVLSGFSSRRSCGFADLCSRKLFDVHEGFFADLAQPGVEFLLIFLLPDVPRNLVSAHLR